MLRQAMATVRGLAVVAAMVLTTGAGQARAGAHDTWTAPNHVTLGFVCTFPVIGDQDMTASFAWQGPATLPVGQPSPRFPVDVDASIVPAVPQSLRVLGAATFEGTVSAAITVAAPQGDVPVDLELTVPKTGVPGAGAMPVEATGTAPALAFSRPGVARISVGDLRLHLTARKSGGGKILFGSLDASCTPRCGQNGLVASLVITEGGDTPAADTTRSVPPSTGAPRCSAAAGGTSVASRLMPYAAPLTMTAAGVVVLAGVGTALFFRRRHRRAAGKLPSSED